MEANNTSTIKVSDPNSIKAFFYETKYIILFYALGDWITTYYALPFGFEGNSIPAIILERYGIFSLLLVKLLFVVMMYFIYPTINKSKFGWKATKRIMESIGVFVVVNNVMVILYGISLVQLIGLF